jgi:hypothetical protein
MHRVCLTTLVAAVTSTVSPASAQDPARDCDSGPTFIACQRQGEPALFRKYPGVAHRRGNDLVLVLTNGDSAVVRDTISPNSDYGSQYWLADIDVRSGYFILAMNGYENRGSLVVSRRTGWRRFFDFNLPVFQSAGLYAAVLIPVGAAYWEPTIDVFRVTPDSLIRELHLESPATPDPFVRGDTLWGPTNPRWVGEQLLFDTEETLVRNRRNQWPGKPMLLAKSKGRWELRRGK